MSAISEWSQVITKGSVMTSIRVDDFPWSFVSVFLSVLQPMLLVLVRNDNRGRKDSVMTGMHRELAIIDIWSTLIWSLVTFPLLVFFGTFQVIAKCCMRGALVDLASEFGLATHGA